MKYAEIKYDRYIGQWSPIRDIWPSVRVAASLWRILYASFYVCRLQTFFFIYSRHGISILHKFVQFIANKHQDQIIGGKYCIFNVEVLELIEGTQGIKYGHNYLAFFCSLILAAHITNQIFKKGKIERLLDYSTI